MNTNLSIVPYLVVLLLSHASAESALSQTRPRSEEPQFEIRHFGMRDGLPHDYVYCIIEDRRGLMWFGTRDGLCRFDGSEFTTYRRSKSDTASLPDNVIFCLAEGRDGSIWVGTLMGGLARLDPTTGKVRRYSVPSDRAKAQGSPVRGLCVDSTGKIWVRFSSNSIYRLDPKNETWFKVQGLKPNLWGESQRLPIQTVSDKTIWTIGDKGPLMIDPVSGLVHEVFEDAHQVVDDLGIRGFQCSQMIETVDGNLIAANGSYLVCMHGRDRHLHAAAKNASEQFEPCIARSSNDAIFVAGQFGVWCYKIDPSHPHTLRLQQENYVLQDVFTHSLLGDRFGRMWIGTDRGLYVLRESDKQINFKLMTRYSSGIKNDLEYRSVVMADDSACLVGTASGKLLRYDFASTSWSALLDLGHSLKASKIKDSYRKRGTMYLPITTVYQRYNGTFSLGTSSDGVILLSDKNRDARSLYVLRPMHVRTSLMMASTGMNIGVQVYTLVDAENGDLYIGSLYLDQLVITEVNNQLQEKRLFKVVSATEGHQIIWSINWLEPRRLLVATTIGLFTLDLNSGAAIAVRGSEGLNVSCTIQTSNELWYCGTYGSGLSIYDRKTERFSHSSRLDDAQIDDIYSIVKDKDGVLWMSTDRGLVRYHPERDMLTVYGKNHGITDCLFYPRAGAVAPTGELLFGTSRGLLVFNPAARTRRHKFSSVGITSLSVIGQISRHFVQHGDSIEYDESDSPLQFTVTSLDYEDVDRVQYRYRLIGADTSWIYTSRNSVSVVNQLEAGSYVLQLQASDWDGNWTRTGMEVYLTVHPPLWRHPYALGLWAFLGCTIVGGITYRRNVRQRQMRLALEEARIAERRVIASSLHDGPLQELYGVRFQLEGQSSVDHNTIQMVQDLVASARHGIGVVCSDLRTNMRQADLRESVQQILVSFAQNHPSVSLTTSMLESLSRTYVSINEKEACVAILRTCLLNVGEHADAKHVSVDISIDKRRLVLTIVDDGKGIEATRTGMHDENRGKGLLMCHAFAEGCGGSFSIVQQKTGGTIARFTTAASWNRSEWHTMYAQFAKRRQARKH